MNRHPLSGLQYRLQQYQAFSALQTPELMRAAQEAGYGEPEVVEEKDSAEIRIGAYIESHGLCEMWGLPGSMAVSDVGFARAMDKARATGKAVRVRLNSGGGDVFAGVAISNRVREAGAAVVVDGLAASIASVIAAASPHVTMLPGTTMMVHNPWSCVCGNARGMRAEADVLDKLRESMLDVYVGKTRETYTRAQWQAALDGKDGADGTWLSAAECLAVGVADVAPTPDVDRPTASMIEQRQASATLNGVKLPTNLAELPDGAAPLKPVKDPTTRGATVETAPGVRVSHRKGAFYVPRT